MLRVILDTNVWISAFLFGGVPARILELALEDKVEIGISPILAQELADTLKDRKFGLSTGTIETLLGEMTSITVPVYPEKTLDIIKRDSDDNRVLECAMAHEADIIISGDKDILELEKFRGIFILNPRQFISAFDPQSGK